MTNNKIERTDFYAALEDGLMTCLEHEENPVQMNRLRSLLIMSRDFIKQEEEEAVNNTSKTPVPAATDKDKQITELTAKVMSLKTSLANAMEAGKILHQSFCKKLIEEFIQQHVYTTLDSEKWESLYKLN